MDWGTSGLKLSVTSWRCRLRRSERMSVAIPIDGEAEAVGMAGQSAGAPIAARGARAVPPA